jgi:hypothetical protein
MSHDTTPAGAGQQTASTPTDPLTEILTEIRKLGTRLDIIERRIEYVARAEGLDLNELNAIGPESKLAPSSSPSSSPASPPGATGSSCSTSPT